MREKPWMVIDVLTDETLGWYETDHAAAIAHKGEPVVIQYRPGRKKRVKR